MTSCIYFALSTSREREKKESGEETAVYSFCNVSHQQNFEVSWKFSESLWGNNKCMWIWWTPSLISSLAHSLKWLPYIEPWRHLPTHLFRVQICFQAILLCVKASCSNVHCTSPTRMTYPSKARLRNSSTCSLTRLSTGVWWYGKKGASLSLPMIT